MSLYARLTAARPYLSLPRPLQTLALTSSSRRT